MLVATLNQMHTEALPHKGSSTKKKLSFYASDFPSFNPNGTLKICSDYLVLKYRYMQKVMGTSREFSNNVTGRPSYLVSEYEMWPIWQYDPTLGPLVSWTWCWFHLAGRVCKQLPLEEHMGCLFWRFAPGRREDESCQPLEHPSWGAYIPL